MRYEAQQISAQARTGMSIAMTGGVLNVAGIAAEIFIPEAAVSDEQHLLSIVNDVAPFAIYGGTALAVTGLAVAVSAFNKARRL